MSRKIQCHQCKGFVFYILYSAETRNSAAICNACDATVVYDVMSPPPTESHATPAVLDLPPVVEDASGLEGGVSLYFMNEINRLSISLIKLETRLDILEASK